MKNKKDILFLWKKNNPEKIKSYRDKYRINNPEKCKESLRKWRINNPEKIKVYKQKNPKKYKYPINFEKQKNISLKKYNLNLEQYKKILNEQNNVCKICNKNNKSNKSLGVDHNHINGKIRGLLCDKCNRGLGCFNDDINLFIKAIKYLKGEENPTTSA